MKYGFNKEICHYLRLVSLLKNQRSSVVELPTKKPLNEPFVLTFFVIRI